MSLKLNTNNNKVLQLEADGEISKEEFNYMINEFKFRLKGNKHIRYYAKLNHVKMPPTEFFVADLQLVDKFKDKMERVAIVGDSEWQKDWCKFMQDLTGAEIRFFDIAQQSQAWQWINAGLSKAS